MNIIGRIAAIAALGAFAAGCSGSSSGGRIQVSPPSQAAQEAHAINELLLRGDVGEARKRIKAALKRDPQDAAVQLLRDSIEREPKDLLGPQSFDYIVRQGDTVPDLAQRFLGNRLKAYQLGRYAGLSAPFTLAPGQTIQIPGSGPRAEPVRRLPAPQRPAPPPAVAMPAKPAGKPSTPIAAANPALARQLRGAGLTALNQGNVQRAIGLLRRAAASDLGNPLIARDLARAERIAATVRARR
jgi:hypothetical protein